MNLKIKSVSNELFKAFVFLFLLVGGTWFFVVFTSDLSIFLIITNFILTSILALKWKFRWFLILVSLALIYFGLFIFLPSEPCGSSHIKLGVETSCECKGITKSWSLLVNSNSGMFYDSCIGKRIKCYSYGNVFSSSKIKEEIPCE